MKAKILFSALILSLSQFSFGAEQPNNALQASSTPKISINAKALDDALSGFGLLLYYQEQQLAERSLRVSAKKIEAYMNKQEVHFHHYIASTLKQQFINQQNHVLTNSHTTDF